MVDEQDMGLTRRAIACHKHILGVRVVLVEYVLPAGKELPLILNLMGFDATSWIAAVTLALMMDERVNPA